MKESCNNLSIARLAPGKVLLIGESLGLFSAQQEGSCTTVESFGASVAGAELNVAVGLRRLGQNPVYITKIGDDPLGERIRLMLERNNIDISGVHIDTKHPTGLMLKSCEHEADPKVYYFRKHSAASTLAATDIDSLDFSDISVLHLTGIFPPLSESTREACFHLLSLAKDNGVFISFDPNIRPSLWNSLADMRSTLLNIASQADLVMPGISEGEALLGLSDPLHICESFLSLGSSCVVVKNGPEGAYFSDGSQIVIVPGFELNAIVDTVGAGDGFAAGFLASLLEGREIRESLVRACAVGAIQTQFVSDNEGLPSPHQLDTFIASHHQ